MVGQGGVMRALPPEFEDSTQSSSKVAIRQLRVMRWRIVGRGQIQHLQREYTRPML